jgi:hypothetical protein
MERKHTTGGFNTRLYFSLSLPFPPCGLSLLQHIQHLDAIAEEPLLGRLVRVLRGQELPTDRGKAHNPTYSMGGYTLPDAMPGCGQRPALLTCGMTGVWSCHALAIAAAGQWALGVPGEQTW